MEQVLTINSILLWLGLLFNFVLILALTRRVSHIKQPTTPEALQSGTLAPSFQAKTLAENRLINQDNYKGKNIGFVFIGTNCSPCRDFLPYVLELAPVARQYSVDLVLVSDAEAESTRKFLESFSNNLPVLLAPRKDSTFLNDYKVRGTPWYCLVNAKGLVQACGYPGERADAVRKQILTMQTDQSETSLSKTYAMKS